MTDAELRELMDKAVAKYFDCDAKAFQDELNNIRGLLTDEGRVAQAEQAIKDINEQIKSMSETVEKKFSNIARQVRAENGRYRGRAFADEEQAITFGLGAIVQMGLPMASEAKEMLKSEFPDAHARATGTAHDGEESFVTHEHYRRVQRLTEEYGLFPRLAFRQPMTSDTGTFHRRKSGLRARKTKVRTQVSEQTAGWEPVSLTAEDFDILVSYPISLDEDMLISFAELLAEEMSLGFAIALDEDGFVGDGTADYDNEVGLVTRLTQVNGTDDGGGIVLGSGNVGDGWDSLAKDDFLKMIGRARYVRAGRANYISSNEFFWTVVAPIISDAGGRTIMETQSGLKLNFFGVPWEITPVMPRVAGNSQVPCLYGDMFLSSTIGDRRSLTIRESREVRFESKEVVVLGSARYAINNHTVGDATTAGPMVGMATPAAA